MNRKKQRQEKLDPTLEGLLDDQKLPEGHFEIEPAENFRIGKIKQHFRKVPQTVKVDKAAIENARNTPPIDDGDTSLNFD